MYYIVVDGNIGSGKSTLIKNLKNIFKADNIIICEEDINSWINSGWLEKYYENDRYSFGFQMKVTLSHFKQIKEIKENHKNLDNKIIITERSAFTSLHIFSKLLERTGKLDPLEVKLHQEYFDFMGCKPDLIICLDTTPENAFKRIIQRERSGEASISLDYIRKLDKEYKNLNENSYNVKTIYIDANNTQEKVTKFCKDIILNSS